MKKTAIFCTALLGITLFCSPVLAANTANGQVGIFTPGAAGQYNGSNQVNGIGAMIDDRASGCTANGWVGLFKGDTENNRIGDAIGAAIGWTKDSTANGLVGSFYSSRRNVIEIATGAEIIGGAESSQGRYNTAIGNVGIFTGSYDNKMLGVIIAGQPFGSVGAHIGAGDHNTANGSVGIFTNVGFKFDPFGNKQFNSSYGNTVYASLGAVIDQGSYNSAIGNVGIFTGVASHNSNQDALDVTNNTILKSTGAYIAGGNHNTANGTVGSFTLGNWGSCMRDNTVQGTGAIITGGSYNTATGQVGIFNGGMNINNRVTGTGAIISHAAPN